MILKFRIISGNLHFKLYIRYIFGSVPQDQLAAFYRDARVGLITPLRDGMNLVAKEFVACQPEQDPGVLILSPFAGAGGYMQEALQVLNAISQIFTLIP